MTRDSFLVGPPPYRRNQAIAATAVPTIDEICGADVPLVVDGAGASPLVDFGAEVAFGSLLDGALVSFGSLLDGALVSLGALVVSLGALVEGALVDLTEGALVSFGALVSLGALVSFGALVDPTSPIVSSSQSSSVDLGALVDLTEGALVALGALVEGALVDLTEGALVALGALVDPTSPIISSSQSSSVDLGDLVDLTEGALVDLTEGALVDLTECGCNPR